MNESEQKLIRSLNGSFFRLARLDAYYPETLYHYTSADGLHGILSSGKIWGTNYSFLNDSSELVYGRDLALQVVKEKLEIEEDELGRSFFKGVYDRLSTSVEAIDFYLTCFCKTPDLLSQWRGYGTAAGRFCIGFNTEQLLHETKVKPLNHFSGSCVYAKDKQRSKVEWTLDKARETLMEGRAGNQSFRASIADKLIQKLLREICFFKDPGFEEEHEWRMVHFAPDASSVHFKASAGFLKPFVNMVAATAPGILPITEITVGKSRIGALAKKSVDLLLKKCNYIDVEVRDSMVPIQDF